MKSVRQPVAPDNPFLASSGGLDRDQCKLGPGSRPARRRDRVTVLPDLRRPDERWASRRRPGPSPRRSRPSRASLPAVREALEAVDRGGFLEAIARVGALMAVAAGRVPVEPIGAEKRPATIGRRAVEAHRGRSQAASGPSRPLWCELEPERALESLPKLLADSRRSRARDRPSGEGGRDGRAESGPEGHARPDPPCPGAHPGDATQRGNGRARSEPTGFHVGPHNGPSNMSGGRSLMENIKNVTFDEIQVGASASFAACSPSLTSSFWPWSRATSTRSTSRARGRCAPDPTPGPPRPGGAQAIIAAALGTTLAGARDDDPPPESPLPRHDHGRRRADGDGEGHREMPEGSRGRFRLPVHQPGGGKRGAGNGHRGGTDAVASRTPRWHHPDRRSAGAMGSPAFSRPARQSPPVVCAVVHPCDRDSLLGPLQAARRGLIDPVFVGPEDKIQVGRTGRGC